MELASSNQTVKNAVTWNKELTSSSIYKTGKKNISYLFTERDYENYRH